MSGDNVVRPVFGVRKAEVEVQNTVTPESAPIANEAQDFEHDIDYCLSNLERVWEAHLRGDEMTNYLFDDIGYQKTDTSLQLRRPIVRGYSFEEFCSRLLNSSRVEWRAQPAFFGSLFMEFHDRQNFILISLEARKEQIKALTKDHMAILMKLIARASF